MAAVYDRGVKSSNGTNADVEKKLRPLISWPDGDIVKACASWASNTTVPVTETYCEGPDAPCCTYKRYGTDGPSVGVALPVPVAKVRLGAGQ